MEVRDGLHDGCGSRDVERQTQRHEVMSQIGDE